MLSQGRVKDSESSIEVLAETQGVQSGPVAPAWIPPESVIVLAGAGAHVSRTAG